MRTCTSTILAAVLISHVLAAAQTPARSVDRPQYDESTVFTMDDIRLGLLRRESEIENVRVKFRFAMRSGKVEDPQALHALPPSSEYLIEAVMGDDRLRYSRQTVTGNRSPEGTLETVTWDGRTKMTRRQEPRGHVYGTIARDRYPVIAADLWQTLFGARVFTNAQTLAEFTSRHEVSSLGSRRVGGRVAWGVECYPAKYQRFEIWLDPNRGFAPVEITLTFTDDDRLLALQRLTNVELDEIAGRWIPIKGDLVMQNNVIAPGEYRLNTIDIEQYEADVELPEALFTLSFPKGARMHDVRRDLYFLMGEGVYARDEDGREQFVPTEDTSEDTLDAMLATMPPRQPLSLPADTVAAAPPRRLSQTSGLLLRIALAAGLLAVLVIYIRQRRRDAAAEGES